MNTNLWEQKQKITSININDDNNFGDEVAIFNDVAVIGEPRDDYDSTNDIGRAYIYRLNGDTWTLEQSLVPTIQDHNLAFGLALAVDGDVIAVGAPGDPNNFIQTLDDRVYVYTYNGIAWQLVGNPIVGVGLESSSDGFGNGVDIDGDWIVVGAPFSFTGDAVFYYYYPYSAINNPI